MQTGPSTLSLSSTHTTDGIRVLHFAPRVCWPLDTGAKLRNYHLARVVSQSARITLLAFSENREPSESLSTPSASGSAVDPPLATPKEFYERVKLVGRGQGYTPLKVLRGALGATPLPVLNYTTPEMARALEETLHEQAFDVVQVESIHLSAYLPVLRAARSQPLVICDWHNIESELMQRYSEHARGPLRRTYARRTARQLARLEREALIKFDAHVVVSAEEREKLSRLQPGARLSLIENGVDTAYYSPERIAQAHARWLAQQQQTDGGRGAANSAARRLLFVGSMDYHANIDAVTHFAREVWPQVRALHPELIYTIVGRDPAPEVRQLAELPGIEVTGTVNDVRPYYHDALMAVIPLRVGGGSRLKILEAMAAGVPVVSTRLGAEGIEAEDGENIVLADTGAELCEAVGNLVAHEERRRALASGGQALAAARYDWARLGALLIETYRSLMRGRESLPLAPQREPATARL